MKYYQEYSVLKAARARINWVFDEFRNVVVGFSGGKDSTVTLNLALEIAAERNRLPLPVMFLDQEAEWQATIDHVREIMADPRVKPIWLQVPFRMSNSASHTNDFQNAWQEGAEWIRDKEPNSIHENVFGVDRFGEMFAAVLEYYYPNDPACYLAGVRCEESPTRFVAITTQATYKHVTWGKKLNPKKGHYTLYPLYDWTYIDIWKAIHDYGWSYCRLYDLQYQMGRNPKDMRVSNVHHETATHDLIFMQEIEPKTWSKLAKRLDGANTVKHLKKDSNRCPKVLPEAFEDWKDYRDYLLEKLITNPESRDKLRKEFDRMDDKYSGMGNIKEMHKVGIKTILVNDYSLTKIANWERNPMVHSFRQWKFKGISPKTAGNRFINEATI